MTEIYIYRAPKDKENPYFLFRRDTAQDESLTFEARGVLAYLLSKPDDWKLQPKDLEQQCKKSVVYRILNELIDHNYIERVQHRDEKKRIVAWNYIVHEEPLPKNQEVGLQEVEKTDITNKRVKQKKEGTATARKSSSGIFKPLFDQFIDVWAHETKAMVNDLYKWRWAAKRLLELDPPASIGEIETVCRLKMVDRKTDYEFRYLLDDIPARRKQLVQQAKEAEAQSAAQERVEAERRANRILWGLESAEVLEDAS